MSPEDQRLIDLLPVDERLLAMAETPEEKVWLAVMRDMGIDPQQAIHMLLKKRSILDYIYKSGKK